MDLHQLLEAEAKQSQIVKARESFIDYAQRVRPDLIIGRHHRLLARRFEAILSGKLKRLMIFMPPGHSKSLMGSILLPSWFLGRYPQRRVLHISHTAELVQGFGREVRDLLQTEEYREIFPNVELRPDVKAVGRWHTTHGGIYTAAGVGGAISGKRGDLGILDDVISEQDAYSEVARRTFKQWYPGGFRTRLMPGAPIVWINTRWAFNDPAGWEREQAEERGEAWDVVELPAILDDVAAAILGDGAKSGEALFPELWPLKELEAIRAELPRSQWEALYQQKPRPEEGGILKPAWWKRWPNGKSMPNALHIVQSWDTAYSTEALKSNSYSARSTWAIFEDENRGSGMHAMLLLEAWRGRVDYPELRREAMKAYMDYKPDRVLVEKKASGLSLVQDLRKSGLPISTYQPDRDKVARAYAVQAMLESGQIWAPERRWADEFIQDLAQFPNGDSKDWTDTATQAWLLLRNGHWLHHPDDKDDDPEQTRRSSRAPAYG